ncbi:endonuclease/exonuclease/phosphatase family protein, partial [Gammaproteobacteria bacterium]|nr:endonuclease/exonuclease/phosphatase family protein [Gammaproteobacteria bacterium]
MLLRVLTYNIHKGFSMANRRFVLRKIRDQLRKLDVDLVFLQEVQGEHIQHEKNISDWPKEPQFEFLADQVWSHHAYGKNAIQDGKHHGNAILSKYPFTEWSNINVSYLSSASRSLLHGTITIPEKSCSIHVVCLHLGLSSFERKRQIKRLNEHLKTKQKSNIPIIIGGDFNDWSGREVANHLNPELGLDEIFFQTHQRYAKTFPANWPLFCVDRIYFSGLVPVSCHCLNGKPWNTLSDHVPLLAEFE